MKQKIVSVVGIVLLVGVLGLGIAVAAEGFLSTDGGTFTGGGCTITNLERNVSIAKINVISPSGSLAGTSIVCRLSNKAAATSIVFQSSVNVTNSTSFRIGFPGDKWAYNGRLILTWGPTNPVVVEIDPISY